MSETSEKILERLENELPERYVMKPGSYTYDIEKAHAIEFENAYDRMDRLKQQSHASTATGKYLEKCVSDFGIKRKSSTSSGGYVTIIKDVDAVVKAGDKVAAGNVIFNITDTVTTTGESCTVPVICDVAGSQGNVKAGYINRFPVTLPGLKSVRNTHPTTGGSDEETDTELRARYYEFISHPITSGNKWQYIMWAKSVDGVGDAKCQPLWNGNGTVKVIIVDSKKQIAPPELIDNVKKYIEEQQPIGATLTVVTAEEKSINISCKLDCEPDSIDMVKANLEEYLRNISFAKGYISYAKTGQIIMDTAGVTDYTDLLVNGDTANIPITDTEIAVLGVVSFD